MAIKWPYTHHLWKHLVNDTLVTYDCKSELSKGVVKTLGF